MKLMQQDPNDVFTGKVGNFSFSGTRPEKLGSTEYTLVTINQDMSGSTSGFSKELHQAMKEVVDACKKSPRAEFLMIRYVRFNGNIEEVFGFTPVNSIDMSQINEVQSSGTTALNDTVFASAMITTAYAKTLADQYYSVNAIEVTITDGIDVGSLHTVGEVKNALQKGVKDEVLESTLNILIGVNTSNAQVKNALNQFQQDTGMDQYVDIQDATASELAKMAKFISKSISSQSQSLGTGGKSQTFTF